jgi:hypothetical protein
MESKDLPKKNKAGLVLRSIILLLLCLILLIFAWEYDTFQQFLQCHRPERILTLPLWNSFIKLISYSIQILLDYFILWVLTKNHKYPVVMSIISVGALLFGLILVLITQHFGHSLNLQVSSLIVKLVKSQIILVLLVAAYIVETVYNSKTST